jgi:hypothetical protein
MDMHGYYGIMLRLVTASILLRQHRAQEKTQIMLKNLVFYTIAGSVIALIAQAAGASLTLVLLLSLLGPPLILLVIAIIRYKNI